MLETLSVATVTALNALEDEQFENVKKFKAQMQQRGLLGTYSGPANIREQVQLHLTSVVSDLSQP